MAAGLWGPRASVAFKMADGLCTEDTVSASISDKSTLVVKDYVVNECGVNDNDNLVANACANVKSFFLQSDCGELYGKVCGVLQKGSKHEEGFLEEDMPCSSPEEDCRKKRCADRYDSSESSDSGVATLSCTDCSTYSGGSTASSASDITDPGSPFSTASSHSEDSSAASNNSQPPKMAPNLSAHHTPWPWSGNGNGNGNGDGDGNANSNSINNGSNSPPLKRSNSIEEKTANINNNNINNNNHKHSHSNKRLRTETSNLINNSSSTNDMNVKNAKCNLKITKTLPTVKDSNCNQIALPATINTNQLSSSVVVTAPVTKRQTSKRLETALSFVVGNKVQQGKITEYFKAQMKPNTTIKRELISTKNLDNAQGVHKYFTLVDGPKVILDSRCSKFPPNWSKLDVHSLTVATPVKKVILDTKTKKISQLLNSVPRKILPAPRNKKAPTDKTNLNQSIKVSQPMVKLTALRYQQQLQDSLHASPKPAKPPDNSTNCKMQKYPITNLNLTVSSTVVPIVKLNTLPSKLNGSNLKINNVNDNINTNLSVETAVPTVPTPKSKSSNLVLTTSVLQKSPQPKKSPSLDSNISSTDSTNSETTPMSSALSVADSDSGFSSLLTVSVASTPTSESATEPQKSPILSQPKTIRFPAKQTEEQRRQDNTDSGLCRWQECHAQFDTSGALLEHLQIKHVISQATQEHYVCLWVGCKVHGRTSCSRSWLERHVLGHAGNKPFRCIVDGCGCRFSSQQALEKHVNSHFNASENSSSSSTRKSLESGTTKLFKRNGKKLRYRRQPWSARMFDFFDAGIMEGLQHRLITMTERRTAGDICNKSSGDSVTVHARILARRTEPDGQRKVLLKWHPPDLLPDEWVLESESISTKTVSIPTLEPSALDALRSTLFPSEKPSEKNHVVNGEHIQQQKHRRKRTARSS